ncbi:organic hydroperoxide resistance protein OhrB [Virgibacillus pantothenticus]|uniref:Organic hydroperoxide resistance protein OhrA n=1 Tax=Virgibacillus pantothenticus TaxID=1473 RepID=A0A0L0QNB4_VIRPA|nr:MULTISPECIES: organic hydroperoxide resistance protein [Virgibacillus]API93825.1 Organic hydroperoxide resistance protein OhrA [Virgibacillus sp. 6R]KNE20110.1 Organic hydroperoxide resistance protein OhrA [Virgibacillus pantothenticus]MBS7427630.1 organic hydroperoxide resistance protein [Virgibacillus sp. 19R1-5]MBU8565879.1 organic hydroperoxide resistance protein [Virgibacillus pantothenticus]MBU8601096.1 organic hydroperoxide resistance protein [Virgibacillus pantothenticus]
MANVIFTSKATAKNGRDGHVKSEDGLIDVKLVNPATNKEDKGSNPEQLFAAAYASCFDGALNLVASKYKKEIDSLTTAAVSFLNDPEDNGFKISVELLVKIKGVDQNEAEDLVKKAHQVCPYSKATRGNIDVQLKPEAV